MALEVVEGDVDLGAVVGLLKLKQLTPQSFNEACKSTSSSAAATDCTGQRVYAGCQTMVWFLANHPWLVRGRTVVELGCGVGACGLALAARLGAGKVVLTDGQPSTLALTRTNAEALGLLQEGRVSVRRLLFGTPGSGGSDDDGAGDACRALLAEEGLGGEGADVVVGCELMYFNVCPAAVLATAAALVRRGGREEEEAGAAREGGDGSGVILLAHIFRGAHLPQALADAAGALGLWLLNVPVEAALTDADRAGGASYWTKVSLLLCLPRAPGMGGFRGGGLIGGVYVLWVD